MQLIVRACLDCAFSILAGNLDVVEATAEVFSKTDELEEIGEISDQIGDAVICDDRVLGFVRDIRRRWAGDWIVLIGVTTMSFCRVRPICTESK